VVYKSSLKDLTSLIKEFKNTQNISQTYYRQTKTVVHKNYIYLFSNIGIDRGKNYNNNKYEAGVEIDLFNYNQSSKIYFHNYQNEIRLQENLFKIYQNNLFALNYYKNQFLKDVSEMFKFYSRYEPKYKFLYQKYSFTFPNSKKEKITSLKIHKIDIQKLKESLKKNRFQFVKKLQNIHSPTLIEKLKTKLKLSLSRDNQNTYASFDINIKYPLNSDENIKLEKMQILNRYDQLCFTAISLASKINQTYYQYKQILFNIHTNIQNINVYMLKLKNSLKVDLDKTTSAFINVYNQLNTLNNIIYQNSIAYYELKTLLKDINAD
jgi:hypothetical protein